MREDILSKLLSVENSPTETFFVEINLRRKKMVTQLLLQCKAKKNLIIVGNFNVCMEEICMSGFCDTLGLKSLIKDATCYKDTENPSSTDLILPNNPRSFKKSCYLDRFIGFS